jgi:hypothetical protein
MTNSFAGFRAFLEKFEPQSDKDKDAAKDRINGKDKSMDYLGGLQRELGIRKASTLAKIIRTTPEVPAGMQIDGLDAKYVPVKFDPNLRGGSMQVLPVGNVMVASKDGRDVPPDKIDRSRKRVKRSGIVKTLERGWGPAVAAAAARDAAGGGGAPPMPGM